MENPELVKQTESESAELLIAELASQDKAVRKMAFDALAAKGDAAVGGLVKALSDGHPEVRLQAAQLLDKIPADWTRHADRDTVNALIADLASEDGIVRLKARQALVSIGGKTVSLLSNLLKSERQPERWEAAKALSQIGDSAAIGVLVEALNDETFDIRWLAAEGLVNIGPPSVAPILKTLVEHSDSVWIREGAHHVFRDLHDPSLIMKLHPVLLALEDPDRLLEIPLAAREVLEALSDSGPKKEKA